MSSSMDIDDLFERYLELLDSYTRLRAELSKQFSVGFLSLAQANFAAPHRMRYGQDLYDERMQATLKVNVENGPSADEYTFKPFWTFPLPQYCKANDNQPADTAGSPTDATQRAASQDGTTTLETQAATPPAGRKLSPSHGNVDTRTSSETSELQEAPCVVPGAAARADQWRARKSAASEATVGDDDDDDGGDSKDGAETVLAETAPPPKPRDPLRQFGILVPPALRATQAAFAGAAREQIVRLVELVSEMKAVERTIEEARQLRGDENDKRNLKRPGAPATQNEKANELDNLSDQVKAMEVR